MTARSVAWDSGEAIPGTYFRQMIKGTDAGGRFSSQSAVLQAGELVLPHPHRDEDEFTFVFRGRVGGRVGENDVVAEEGEFLFKPPLRGIPTACWLVASLDPDANREMGLYRSGQFARNDSNPDYRHVRDR